MALQPSSSVIRCHAVDNVNIGCTCFPFVGCLAIVLSRTGRAADLVAKYRPACPVLVVSDQDWLLRQISPRFGLLPFKVQNITSVSDVVAAALDFAM